MSAEGNTGGQATSGTYAVNPIFCGIPFRVALVGKPPVAPYAVNPIFCGIPFRVAPVACPPVSGGSAV
jgi:hypothetical protein